jgi:hypothetical protein
MVTRDVLRTGVKRLSSQLPLRLGTELLCVGYAAVVVFHLPHIYSSYIRLRVGVLADIGARHIRCGTELHDICSVI